MNTDRERAYLLSSWVADDGTDAKVTSAQQILSYSYNLSRETGESQTSSVQKELRWAFGAVPDVIGQAGIGVHGADSAHGAGWRAVLGNIHVISGPGEPRRFVGIQDRYSD